MTDNAHISGTLDQIHRLVEGVRSTEDMMKADPENSDLIAANRIFLKADTLDLLTDLVNRSATGSSSSNLRAIRLAFPLVVVKLRSPDMSDARWCREVEDVRLSILRVTAGTGWSEKELCDLEQSSRPERTGNSAA